MILLGLLITVGWPPIYVCTFSILLCAVLPTYRDAVILQGRIAYLRVDGIAGTATVSQRGTGDNAQ